eukprot:451046-Prorocentrum_minimum.AAC.1
MRPRQLRRRRKKRPNFNAVSEISTRAAECAIYHQTVRTQEGWVYSHDGPIRCRMTVIALFRRVVAASFRRRRANGSSCIITIPCRTPPEPLLNPS